MSILPKKDFLQKVFTHHSGWNNLRGAETDGNLQPADPYYFIFLCVVERVIMEMYL